MPIKMRGEVEEVLEEKKGVSAAGKEWRKGAFILGMDKDGEYPKILKIDVWGDLCDKIPPTGSIVEAKVDIASREYNGNFYTDVKAFKIHVEKEAEKPPAHTPSPTPQQHQPQQQFDDDIPF
jgi:hypothetical protein